MKTQFPSIALFLIVMLTLGALAGCVGNIPHRTLGPVKGDCINNRTKECMGSYYQEHKDFDLAFAEFSERGNAFDRSKINVVLDKIRTHAEQGEGVVVVVFVHGWKHNAHDEDSNVVSFREALYNLTSLLHDAQMPERRLIGLYVGWRGATLNVPYLEQLTFWERKAAAEEVGKGGVTELLLELDQIDQINPLNALVTIGHSFGGAIVLSALAETLTEKVINLPVASSSPPDKIRGVGDAVILLNPAIEANQALNLVEAALPRSYNPSQAPLMVSISSDADRATHYAFPVGQTVGLLLTWSQVDLDRQGYVDRITKAPILLREEHLDSTTVGNYAPFLTHRLEIADGGIDCETPDPKSKFTFTTCGQAPEGCRARGWTSTPTYATIEKLPPYYPLSFIKTNGTFIGDHNDIFNPMVSTFLLTLIDDTIRRTIIEEAEARSGKEAEEPMMRILDDTSMLGDQFAKFFNYACQERNRTSH